MARIGQVARETGLSVDTIRYYEKQGLLRKSLRTEGGYRLFGSRDIEALKFIKKAQELGFSLNEIGELMILGAEDVPACTHVKALLDQKLSAVQQKLSQLRKLERALKIAQRKCQQELETVGSDHGECCPVLTEIRRATGAKE